MFGDGEVKIKEEKGVRKKPIIQYNKVLMDNIFKQKELKSLLKFWLE